ncbi:MAG: ankyrin repeat domain-containing protein [Bdellovibrionales bacterium]|nr:ankyrin repeat domain-containing protein [Bdellovibrionales bacterium]
MQHPPSPESLEPPRPDTINKPVDYVGNTYLHALCRAGQPASRVIDAIQKFGAQVNAVNNDGYSPLRYAIEFGTAETVDALMKHGAQPVYKIGNKQFNAVTAAIHRGRADTLVAVLQGGGAAHLNAPGLDHRGDADQTPPVSLAVQKHHYDMIMPLVQAGASPNRTAPGTGYTPLIQAAALDAGRVLHALVRAGADLNGRGSNGQTALHHAADNQHRREALEVLISLGADLEARDGQGRTPLMISVEAGYHRAAERLLQAGANPDARNEKQNGETALMIAARKGHADCAELLLKAKANPLLTDAFNRTAAKISQDSPDANRAHYDPIMGHSAPQPKTMLAEAEKIATAKVFEKQYREQKNKNKKNGP